MKILSFSLLVCALSLFSCKSEPTIDKIAGELCECLQPMIDMYNELENVSDPELLESAMENLSRLAQESEACADNLTAKYGDLEARQQEIDEAMGRVCPNITQRLNEFGSTN